MHISSAAARRAAGLTWRTIAFTGQPHPVSTEHESIVGARSLGLRRIQHRTRHATTQVLDFEAVIWGPGQNQIQELPPLSGDSVAMATETNDQGQSSGASALCSVFTTGIVHLVIWRNGSATDLETWEVSSLTLLFPSTIPAKWRRVRHNRRRHVACVPMAKRHHE